MGVERRECFVRRMPTSSSEFESLDHRRRGSADPGVAARGEDHRTVRPAGVRRGQSHLRRRPVGRCWSIWPPRSRSPGRRGSCSASRVPRPGSPCSASPGGPGDRELHPGGQPRSPCPTKFFTDRDQALAFLREGLDDARPFDDSRLDAAGRPDRPAGVRRPVRPAGAVARPADSRRRGDHRDQPARRRTRPHVPDAGTAGRRAYARAGSGADRARTDGALRPADRPGQSDAAGRPDPAGQRPRRPRRTAAVCAAARPGRVQDRSTTGSGTAPATGS